MRERWPYYRKKIYFLLLLVSFGLGVHGLYQYYHQVIHKGWQLISTILYGTMKLYLFAPPIVATAEVSLSYEIAKWLAPLLTSVLVLTALTNRLLHAKNLLFNLFGKRLLVFGVSEESKTFLNNLHREKSSYKKSLVAIRPLSDEIVQDLEKRGVAVFSEDPQKMTARELKAFIKQTRLLKSEHVFFFSDDETVNYQLFIALLPHLLPQQKTKVHLLLTSEGLRNYVVQSLERKKREESAYGQIDLHFFDLDSLSVDLLLSDGGANHFLAPQLDALLESDPHQSFLPELPPVHLLLLGMNSLSQTLIQRCLNDFTVRQGKIKISLVDEQAQLKSDNFFYDHPTLLEVLEISTYDTLPGRRGFREAIREISDRGVSAAFLNHSDALVNLEALMFLSGKLPIAFRNPNELDLRELIKTHARLIFFGALPEILSSRVVLQEALDQAAFAFNQHYSLVAEAVGAGGGSPWENLTPTKKMSSRLSAAHASVKEAILLNLTGRNKDELKEDLSRLEEQFRQLTADHQGEDFRLALIDFLNATPWLRDLSELEHLRWCHSYYSMGYRLGHEKSELKKTHPCLNESWDFLMNEGFFSCHPEYDLISVLSLFGQKPQPTSFKPAPNEESEYEI